MSRFPEAPGAVKRGRAARCDRLAFNTSLEPVPFIFNVISEANACLTLRCFPSRSNEHVNGKMMGVQAPELPGRGLRESGAGALPGLFAGLRNALSPDCSPWEHGGALSS